MNKKLLSLTVLTLMATTSYKADAMFYVGGSAGISISDVTAVKTKNKIGYSFAAGVNLPIPIVSIRGEAEFSSLNSAKLGVDFGTINVNQIDSNIKANMINVYVGVPPIPLLPIKIYAGYGIGKSELTQEITSSIAIPGLSGSTSGTLKSKKDLAQQYMVGLDVSVPLIPVAGGIEYRYMSKNFEMDNNTTEDVKLHSILGKVRYEF